MRSDAIKKNLPWSMSGTIPSDLSFRLHSDSILRESPLTALLLRAYIPGLQISAISDAPAHIEISHNEIVQTSKQNLTRHHDYHLQLSDAWHGEVSQDLYHLLYSVARIKFLEQFLYPIHASCITLPDGSAVVLAGHSGSGKTSTAIALAREHGAKILSGDKTLIRFGEDCVARVVAGTSTMTIREEHRCDYRDIIGDGERYFNRFAFSLNEKMGAVANNQKIKAIVFIRYNDGVEDRQSLSQLAALHALYPFLLDSLYADTVVANGKGVYIAPIPVLAAQHLVTTLSKALCTLPVYSITGSKEFVVREVAKIC
jgi:hypothetical protein